MTKLQIAPGEALHYEYVAPADKAQTFVFVNALTGSTAMWTAEVCPRLQAEGYGTLAWNFRGQAETEFADGTALTPRLIVADLVRLMAELRPPAPILVGLSIGGLFAAQAYLAGAEAGGLVLVNTLRKPGQRLDWINRAMVELARIGGGRLVMTANMPSIASPALMARTWDTAFSGAAYEPPAATDGLYRLMAGSLESDWDFPYEELAVPVLVLTGEHDRLFRIDTDVAELKARIPNVEEKRYPQAGHLIPMEDPAGLVSDLLVFAKRCAG
jgi:3-oxoadipate enol-lactonase